MDKMNKITVDRFLLPILPFVGIGIFMVLLAVGIVVFSYLFVIGSIIGVILFSALWVYNKFKRSRKQFPPDALSQPLHRGRTIDHEK
jgi:hypothetical protein